MLALHLLLITSLQLFCVNKFSLVVNANLSKEQENKDQKANYYIAKVLPPKIKTICEQKTTINVFIYLDFAQQCEHDIQLQYIFLEKLMNDKRLSKITFLFQYFKYLEYRQVKLNPSNNLQDDLNKVCDKMYRIDNVDMIKIFLQAPAYQSINIFFYYFEEEVIQTLQPFFKRNIFPIYVTLDETGYYRSKFEVFVPETSYTFIHMIATQYDKNKIKNILCYIKTQCFSPQAQYKDYAVLNQSFAKDDQQIYKLGQKFEFICLNKTKKSNKTSKTFNAFCSFSGKYVITGATSSCEEIFCPKLNMSKNVNISDFSNVDDINYHKIYNNGTWRYLSIVTLKCLDEGYQFKEFKHNYAYLICLEKGKWASLEKRNISGNKKQECERATCDSIQSLGNATITTRTKNQIQGKCNEGYSSNFSTSSKEALFVICSKRGIDILLNCQKIRKGLSRGVKAVIGLLVSITCLAIFAFILIFILNRRANVKFRLLEDEDGKKELIS